MTLSLFARLAKVDEAKRQIVGIIADETVDKAGEIFDYATSVPFFKSWSDTVAKASGGASVGNVRAQHGQVVAGRLLDINFDDVAKSISVVADIVDDNEWQKVLKGCYTGFSIGGKYEKKWDDALGKRYTAAPSEVSIVDLGCNPNASFQVHKADGSDEMRKFTAPGDSANASTEAAQGDAPALFAKQQEMVAAGFSPEIAAAGVALFAKRDNADVKAGFDAAAKLVPVMFPAVDLAKGLWNVSSLCDIIRSLDYLTVDVAYEATIEGDKSKVPQALVNAMANLGDTLVAMVKEEVDELMSYYAKSTPTGDLRKEAPTEVTPETLDACEDVSVLRAFAKSLLVKVDALAKAAPAPCGHDHTAQANDLGKLNKAMDEASAGLTKLRGDNTLLKAANETLTKQLATANAEVETLKKMPPTKQPVLKVVGKGEDVGIAAVESDANVVKDKNGKVDEPMTAMRKALAAGPLPLN